MRFEQSVVGKRALLRLVIRAEALVATLALPERQTLAPVHYRLADESVVIPRSFTARVLWEGIERPVRVLQLGSHPLVGMGFLYGYRVCVEALDGGDIEVTWIEN